MKRYYDVHCEFNGDSTSYSIFVEIVAENVTNEDVINFCIENEMFAEKGDEKYVDNITEVTEEEFYKSTFI